MRPLCLIESHIRQTPLQCGCALLFTSFTFCNITISLVISSHHSKCRQLRPSAKTRVPKMTKMRAPKMSCLMNKGDVNFRHSRFGVRTQTPSPNLNFICLQESYFQFQELQESYFQFQIPTSSNSHQQWEWSFILREQFCRVHGMSH